jgi:pyruvate/2-oxoglutarate dehydrogenase complex dihydrolipoamide acyltransferase (E2) component
VHTAGAGSQDLLGATSPMQDGICVGLPGGAMQVVPNSAIRALIQGYADFCPSALHYTYCQTSRSTTLPPRTDSAQAAGAQAAGGPRKRQPNGGHLSQSQSRRLAHLHGVSPNQQDGILPEGADKRVPGSSAVEEHEQPVRDESAEDSESDNALAGSDTRSQAGSSTASEELHINVVNIPMLQPLQRVFHSSAGSFLSSTGSMTDASGSSLSRSSSGASHFSDTSCGHLAELIYPSIIQCATGCDPFESSFDCSCYKSLVLRGLF